MGPGLELGAGERRLWPKRTERHGSSAIAQSGVVADLGIRRVCPPHPWVVLGNSHPSHTRQEGTLGWEVSPHISVLPRTSERELIWKQGHCRYS